MQMDSDSSKNSEQDTLYDKKVSIRNNLTEDTAQFHLKITGNKISAARIVGTFDNYREYNKTLRNNSWENGLNISLENITQYPYHIQIAYAQTFEKLLKNILEVTSRSKYLRTIILELERISCHLSIIGVLGNGVSYPYLYSKANSIRKTILNLLNDLTNSSNGKSNIIIGGVAKDFDLKEIRELNAALDDIRKDSINLRKIFSRNSILKGLLQDVGFLSRDSANKLSLVGPFARASGVTADVRKTDPYAAYETVLFNVPVYDSCDLYGEIMVRLDEIIESIFIIKQLLENLPEGKLVHEFTLSEIPASNSIVRIETPSGELFSFAISKKSSLTDKPVNYHIVSPIKVNIQGILSRLSGESYDNLSTILLFIGEGWSTFI
jgi:NADH:ubiquinone oxidoreductase subunit D